MPQSLQQCFSQNITWPQATAASIHLTLWLSCRDCRSHPPELHEWHRPHAVLSGKHPAVAVCKVAVYTAFISPASTHITPCLSVSCLECVTERSLLVFHKSHRGINVLQDLSNNQLTGQIDPTAAPPAGRRRLFSMGLRRLRRMLLQGPSVTPVPTNQTSEPDNRPQQVRCFGAFTE